MYSVYNRWFVYMCTQPWTVVSHYNIDSDKTGFKNVWTQMWCQYWCLNYRYKSDTLIISEWKMASMWAGQGIGYLEIDWIQTIYE